MRLFWIGLLMTGLVLIGVSTYERREGPVTAPEMAPAGEDGTGFPQPYPTPTPKP